MKHISTFTFRYRDQMATLNSHLILVKGLNEIRKVTFQILYQLSLTLDLTFLIAGTCWNTATHAACTGEMHRV